MKFGAFTEILNESVLDAMTGSGLLITTDESRPDLLAEAQRRGMMTIVRPYIAGIDMDSSPWMAGAIDRCRAAWSKGGADAIASPLVEAGDWSTRAGIAKRAAAEDQIAAALEAKGIPYVVDGVPVGNPSSGALAFEPLVPVIQGHANVIAWAYHAYWTDNPTDAWTTLRYRMIRQAFPVLTKPVLLTECGIDYGSGRALGGWLTHVDWEDYLDQLRAFKAEIARDPYVMGAAIFELAGFWPSFLTIGQPGLSDLWEGRKMPQFILGFKAVHDAIPDIVGDALENEHWSDDGNEIQATSKGLLVWRKADNWTAFTDGYQTWVNGPNGIQQRLNTERFPWEAGYAPPSSSYAPRVLQMPLAASSDRFSYPATPLGYLLHGTRSGVSRPSAEEFPGAAQYEMTRTDGLGAVCTIGDDVIAQHLPFSQWCWHARGCSRYFVGCEFAQGTADDPITDEQVRTFCWIARQNPSIPLVLKTHAEVDGSTQYGGIRDGKTDVFPKGDPRADELRARIMAEMGR